MNLKNKDQKYSLMKAIAAMCDGNGTRGGIENELSDEMKVRDATGRLAQMEGIVLPDMRLLRDAGIVSRDVPDYFGTGDNYGGGHNVISTDLMLGNFIGALTAKTALGKAGIMRLEGLQGDVAIPKCTEDVTAAWITVENGDATKTNPTLANVVMTPHALGAYVDITRKLLIQTGEWVERLVIQLLQDAVARAVETAIFNGSGTSGEPLGILGVNGVQTVSMTADAPTRGDLLDFIGKLETANVDVSTDCAWIGSPAVKKLLAQTADTTVIQNVEGTENVGGFATKYLYANGKAEDYPFITSGLSPAKKLIFGKWSDVVLGSWSGVSIVVDKYTLARSGTVRVVVLSDWDVALRHAESIAVGTALS